MMTLLRSVSIHADVADAGKAAVGGVLLTHFADPSRVRVGTMVGKSHYSMSSSTRTPATTTEYKSNPTTVTA